MKLYQKFENTLPHHKNNLENEEVTNQLTNATKSKQTEFEASVHANLFKGNEIRKYRIYVNITDPFPKKNSESKYI